MFFLVFLFSVFSLFKFFNKKILILLFLELSLVSLICLYLMYSFSSKGVSSFVTGMIFMTFMVIDSVFGLTLLIYSSRNSSMYSNFLFKF